MMGLGGLPPHSESKYRFEPRHPSPKPGILSSLFCQVFSRGGRIRTRDIPVRSRAPYPD